MPSSRLPVAMLSVMGRGGRWRYTLASVSAVLVTVAIGFVTNLVSSGITLKGWQWPAMWTLFGVLILAAVGLDVFRTVHDSPGGGAGADSGAEAECAQVRRTYLRRLRDRYRRVDLEILLPSDQRSIGCVQLTV